MKDVMDIQESHTRVNENGRLVIPAAFRKALGIASGDTLVLRLDDGELKITTLRQRIKRSQQIVRKYVPRTVSLVDELIAERREAAKRE